MSRLWLLAYLGAALVAPVAAAPVPKGSEPPPSCLMFGGTPARNMVNTRDKLPRFPLKGPDWQEEADVKKWRAEWVLWKAELGSRAYGAPVVAGGRVYVGTNNERPRNKRDTRVMPNGEIEPLDKGVLMCFDQKTGAFLWQSVHDKLPNGNVTDWPKEGVCSVPTVVGDRVYYVSNRCTVVCLDANGFADGNDGFQGERFRTETDADIVWEFDMMRELKVFPHNMSNGYPLIVDDRLFVQTSNGVDEGHINLPAPEAPSLICLDRHTGKLLWQDASPGKDIMHGQWSSPSYAHEPVPQVLHAAGDGWLRAFDPEKGTLLWAFDCNHKGAKYELGGTGEKSDFIAVPVVYKGRVYIATGQDPEHTDGPGNLWCIDLKKAVELGAKAKNHDVSPELLLRIDKLPDGKEKAITKPNPASAVAWNFGGPEQHPWRVRDFKFGRTLSTVAVVDDVLYAADLAGYVFCLNANTGQLFWQYDTKACVWGSPYYCDGKVFLANDLGELFVFRHRAKPEKIDPLGFAAANLIVARRQRNEIRKQTESQYLLAMVEFDAPIRSTPVVVGGVLFVMTEKDLYAIGR